MTSSLPSPPRQLHTLPDGRQLAYLCFGAPLKGARTVLLFLHGVPSSASEAAPLHEQAAADGVALLAVDRPGMGVSSAPLAGTRLSLQSFAADLGSLLDGLQLGPVAIAGESGGGPYAAAAAALLGAARVNQLHLIAALGPLAGDGALSTANLAGFDRWSIICTRRRGLGGLGWLMHRAARWLVLRKPAKVAAGAGGELGPADAALFSERPELGQQVVRFLAGAYEQGVRGPLQDYAALGEPWPASIDVAGIRCRTVIWHGDADGCVPACHAEWYAARIPGSELRLLPGEGHLTISAQRGGEIMAAVLGRGGSDGGGVQN